MVRSVIIILSLLLAGAVYGILPGSGYSSEIKSVFDPPDYFAQSLGTDQPDVLDNKYYRYTLEEYLKPPHPPITDPESFKLKRLPYKGKMKTINHDSQYGGWLRYYSISIGSFVDSLMGNVWWTGSSLGSDLGRKNSRSELNQIEKDSLFSSINELLHNRYHISEEAEYISKYENLFGDSSRTEFYGRYETVDNDISIGGWFGKFVSIAVFTDFTDVASFLEQAEWFLRLPPLNRENIIVYEKKKEYVIFLENRENMFILRGYDVYVHGGETPGKSYHKREIARVIELIKYYDEEFMP
jgi:hypothetical protein